MHRVFPSQAMVLIDQLFPFAAAQHETGDIVAIDYAEAHKVTALLELLDRIPSELIDIEGEKYEAYLAGVAILKTAVKSWQESGDGATTVRFISEEYGILNPVTLIRQALAECSEEFPTTSAVKLSFISDVKLRDNLCFDIKMAYQAFSNGEWKAATVLAGAAIESILLWSLQVQPYFSRLTTLEDKPTDIITRWNLNDYIAIANRVGLISDEAETQAGLIRRFRSFIHPSRCQRLARKCTRATALSALAAQELIAEELTGKLNMTEF